MSPETCTADLKRLINENVVTSCWLFTSIWQHYFHKILFFLLAKMMITAKFEVLRAVLLKVQSSGKFLCAECSVVSDISKDRIAFICTLKKSKGRFTHSLPFPCRTHAVPLPCRAAKRLECVFPI